MAPKKNKKATKVVADSSETADPSAINVNDQINEQASEKPRPFLQVHRQQELRALLILLFFSILMFSLPFGAYFGARSLLNEYFELDYFATTCWSVISSVITVGIIIAGYAIVGYYETEYDDEGSIIDQNALPQQLKDE